MASAGLKLGVFVMVPVGCGEPELCSPKDIAMRVTTSHILPYLPG